MSNKVFSYHRRQSAPAHIGSVTIGGTHPIVVQSMANVDTNDIESSTDQAISIASAGAELVRFTTQGVREAKALGKVRSNLNEKGYTFPLVADVHFNARAAYEAAKNVEKVRINPGNFYDPRHTFQHIDYTDEEYAKEVRALQENFEQFLDHCSTHNTAIRIGVNHGSLSDRIMSRYGDTPAGMVASCMEYLEVCQRKSFTNVVLSIKSSNAVVMTETVRLLVGEMDKRGMKYPLHLGVTEAGDGEDGRLKSAVGIGALLSEGIGDTIRVSLSEPPEAEIPVAKLLVQLADELSSLPEVQLSGASIEPLRSNAIPLVLMDDDPSLVTLGDTERPDFVIKSGGKSSGLPILDEEKLFIIDDVDALATTKFPEDRHTIIRLTHPAIPLMLRALDEHMTTPYLLQLTCDSTTEEAPTRMGFSLGSALLRGQANGIWLRSTVLSPDYLTRLSFGLLQASRRRISKTEFISCPGCGRTLFDLQDTVAKVKAATSHLKNLKIGIMGCIVNGPGEMADADYGYVGSAPGKIDLYKSKERVAKNIPQEEAVTRLIDLIKENNDWIEPQQSND